MTQPPPLRSLCVYCGSSPGADPRYASGAQALARELAQRQITLVYGGGCVGLMGVVADAMLAAGGKVIGVIPRALMEKEVGHLQLTELRIVTSMHERKALMAQLADGFVALPGGIGTFEELFEIWTWSQLGIHSKPCALLNIAGYYDPLVDFLDHATRQGFIRQQQRDLLFTTTSPQDLIRHMACYVAPETRQWLNQNQS